MKKFKVGLLLMFLISELSFQTYSMASLGTRFKSAMHKVGDTLRGRKNNADTTVLDQTAIEIKTLANAFNSASSSSAKYVTTKFLTEDYDHTFLVSYGQFTESAGKLLSLLAAVIEKIKAEYATLLGAQNRAERSSRESTIAKNEAKIETNKANMIKCLNLLIGNGIFALIADVKCDAIILLKTILSLEEVSRANVDATKKQLSNLYTRMNRLQSSIQADPSLQSLLTSCAELAEMEVDLSFDEAISELINTIILIYKVVDFANQHITGTQINNMSIENSINEISQDNQNSYNYDNYEDNRQSSYNRRNDSYNERDSYSQERRESNNDFNASSEFEDPMYDEHSDSRNDYYDNYDQQDDDYENASVLLRRNSSYSGRSSNRSLNSRVEYYADDGGEYYDEDPMTDDNWGMQANRNRITTNNARNNSDNRNHQNTQNSGNRTSSSRINTANSSRYNQSIQKNESRRLGNRAMTSNSISRIRRAN